MSTVILGGGIIGSSIAYYLSSKQFTDEIHIIEPSSKLFNAASGYAAGFLARDWFPPSLAPLGALSFDLHHGLAAEHGGEEKWGYMKGTALSLDVTTENEENGVHGDDWLRAGTSRAETASGFDQSNVYDSPAWLTKQRGGIVERISDEDTAVVLVTGNHYLSELRADSSCSDPLRLSQYLINESISRGVKLHHPAKAISIVADDITDTITGIKIVNLNTKEETILPCANLIFSAGPWTPQVFEDLFPSSRKSFPVAPLAGYSLVVRSPRYTLDHERVSHGSRGHAVFTTHPKSCGFSPEIFSRRGGEIYIAGLNDIDIPLSDHAEETHKFIDQNELAKLKTVAVRLMGKLADGNTDSTDATPNIDDLEVLREGLCYRPVSNRGTPFVSRIREESLGNRIKAQGGVFVATGHGPWGISLSLGTGKVVAEMVDGVPTSADVSRLAV